MADMILSVIIVAVIGAAVMYIVKAKKSGVKCIGCPAGGSCSHQHSEASGCGCGCRCSSGCAEGCGGCHAETK